MKEIFCPECGSLLCTMWVLGADESFSGTTERVGHCQNPDCDLDWKTYHSADGLKLLDIERYYFG